MGLFRTYSAKVTVFILFFLFFLSFLSIKLWDYDFWWHIATGRYIVEHKEIPSEDKFSFVTEENRSKYPATALREKVLMRQYWLAQVIFYYIYTTFGSWGIAATRAILLTLTLWLVYKGLRLFEMSTLPSLSLVIPVFYVLLHKYSGERPVLFSFLFSVMVFLIIENFLKSRGKIIYTLPIVMLIWANLHGGFILGIVFISIYLIIETLRFVIKRSDLSKKKFCIFVLTLCVSVSFAILNPNKLLLIPMLFQSKYKIFAENIQEYRPLYEFYFKKVVNLDYTVLFIIAITLAILLLRGIKMGLSHILILIGLFTMSILHQRFFVFTATVGMIIIGKEIMVLYKNTLLRFKSLNTASLKRGGNFFILLAILFFMVKISLAVNNQIRDFSSDHEIIPEEGAINFIEKNKIPGRIFNADIFGGYIIWRLYPWKKVFIDTRSIDIASTVEYRNIIGANPVMVGGKPLWERLLDMYDVNFVVLNPLDYYGNISPLVKEIVENDRWILIYTDGNSLIFMRNNKENEKLINRYRMEKDDAYWSIIAITSYIALENKDNPFLYKTIGYCFMKLKNYDEALKAFGHVLRIQPDDKEVLKMVEEIKLIKDEGEGRNMS
jgi:hypothetical protein